MHPMNGMLKKLLLSIPFINIRYQELQYLRSEQQELQYLRSLQNNDNSKLQRFTRLPEKTTSSVIHSNRNFTYVHADTTNYCNAKCIFCINVREIKPTNITKSLFAKSIAMLPFTTKQGFLFSCAWEPTLNPDFIDLLEMIPARYRTKVFFTTNLVRHISDEELHRLAKVAVNHINISLETFDNEIYKKLTGVKNTFFFDNLDRMHDIFSKYPYSPKIRFITLILRDNHKEIASLAKTAYERYHPEFHEFRAPYIFKHTNYTNEMIYQLLPNEELEKAISSLEALNYEHLVFVNGGGIELIDTTNDRSNNLQTPKETETHTPDVFDIQFSYVAQILPNGIVRLGGCEETTSLKDIDNPFLFFQEALKNLQKSEAKWHSDCNQDMLKSFCNSNSVHGHLDMVIIFDSFYMMLDVNIWSDFASDSSENKYIIVNKNTLYRIKPKPKTEMKPDVICNDNNATASFSCLIDLRDLNMDSMDKILIEAAIYMDDTLKTTEIAEIVTS
jgi:pyruvate-formate lyase-activating enzyme